MAVNKIHRLLANVLYLCTLALVGRADLPGGNFGPDPPPPATTFEDLTIRMDGAISSRLPDENGEYVFLINTSTNFTCIPSTIVEPRQSTVYISLQNRGRYLNGCDCTLQWNLHARDFQCFCTIPWTFRRIGRQEVMCCIDDSYHDDCLNGYSFQIYVIEMSTTEKPTIASTWPFGETDSLTTQLLETMDVTSRIPSHVWETSQGSPKDSTSIPNVPPDSGDGDFRKANSDNNMEAWVLPVCMGAVLVIAVLAFILYWLRRGSRPPANSVPQPSAV